MRQISCIAGLLLAVFVASAAPAREDTVAAGVRAYARENYVRAAELLSPSAQLGDPLAQTYLGFMYQDGRGVPRNYVEAARWFTAAALQGEPTAQFFLALLYNKGFGVKLDFVQAEMWLDVAAAHADSRYRDYWTRMRDAVASKLTADELTQARALALAFAPVRTP